MDPRCFCLAVVGFCLNVHAQQFVNGDLEGVVTGTSVVPPGWQAVPYGDPNCLATWVGGATPDLTDEFGPVPPGIAGIPFSGLTFVSGLATTYSNHEGIMQEVHSLLIDSLYKITFHQAVRRSGGQCDTSGAWAVYLDSMLVDTAEVTLSYYTPTDINLLWNKREVVFQAHDTVHLVKFLPLDDENWLLSGPCNEGGELRMAIDAISLSQTSCQEMFNTTVLADGLGLSAFQSGATYQWLDCDNGMAPVPGAVNQSFTTPAGGNFALRISNQFCADTSNCNEIIDYSGLEEQVGATSFLLPNPAYDLVRVHLPSVITSGILMQINVRDLSGRLIQTQSMVSGEPFVMDISILGTGIFLVTLTDNEDNSLIAAQKLVIM